MYREGKELITTTNHPCLTKWRARIEEAELRGAFTYDDRYASSVWDACAVGEAHEKYGAAYKHTHLYLGPADQRLKTLGEEFSDSVLRNDFAVCRETVTAIEQRLRELA